MRLAKLKCVNVRLCDGGPWYQTNVDEGIIPPLFVDLKYQIFTCLQDASSYSSARLQELPHDIWMHQKGC